MKKNFLPLILFCILDIFLPFIGFFTLLDYNWPVITAHTWLDSKGWLIAPVSILLLVAIVFIYIISVQFPTDQRQAWKMIRTVVISLVLVVAASGTNWQLGLFQYGLLEFLALAAAFGIILPRQQLIIGGLFGLPAIGWAAVASWVSYQLYVATFFYSADWLVWILWPVWLLAAIPLIKNRFVLINGFFEEYKKNH